MEWTVLVTVVDINPILIPSTFLTTLGIACTCRQTQWWIIYVRIKCKKADVLLNLYFFHVLQLLRLWLCYCLFLHRIYKNYLKWKLSLRTVITVTIVSSLAWTLLPRLPQLLQHKDSNYRSYFLCRYIRSWSAQVILCCCFNYCSPLTVAMQPIRLTLW